MTAVDLDALDKLRGALVGLGPFLADTFYECTLSEEDAAEIADALLPVVDRIAKERAAAELRAAAAAAKRGASTVPDLTGQLASFAIATGLELRADALAVT